MSSETLFFAYPAAPPQLGETIELAVRAADGRPRRIVTWRALDIAGHFIRDEVLSRIDEATALVADVTFLNFNVTYEIGYAIGKGKRVQLVKAKGYTEPSSPTIREVGIYDTLGYKEYENSAELTALLSTCDLANPLTLSTASFNLRAPVYLLEPRYKTGFYPVNTDTFS